MFADSVYALPRAVAHHRRGLAAEGEVVASAALLSAALVIGLSTAADYGVTVDEFNTDAYGPKALAWYTSGFADRSHFEAVEEFLWYYGPWFQILTAVVQSFNLADPLTVRHAMTFLVGLAGLAALLPIARLTVGRWAGPSAIMLCLMTGYLYGSLFFTPIDVPFLAAMTWATLAVIVMASRVVPSWPATIGAGLLTGLAMATRTGGIITHAYLLGAMLLCTLEAVVRDGRSAGPTVLRIGIRSATTVGLAWLTAIALWPWLQIGNPLRQFKIAYVHFANLPVSFQITHWGEEVWTNALPWSYIPEQFLARLPEGFLIVLAVGMLLGPATFVLFVRASIARFKQRGIAGLRAPALALARARGILVVVAAAFAPIIFLIVQGSTMYDGIRHVLFVIPILALVAGAGLLRLLPVLRRVPIITVVVAGAYVGATVVILAILHPLEYVATNALAGGTSGSYRRFELDYWSAAATEALRRLERRLNYDTSGQFVDRPPRILICIGWREARVAPMLRTGWLVETDPHKADFIIDTQRWQCGRDAKVVLIDEVKRFDQPFAWIYAVDPGRPR